MGGKAQGYQEKLGFWDHKAWFDNPIEERKT
jgi:hypothetical protein